MLIFRFRKAGTLHFAADTVHAFAKFLHKFILGQQLNDLRIPGEMELPNVADPDKAGEDAGTL